MDIESISQETDLESFLRATFPPHWAPVIRVILESGASFGGKTVKWGPRWSKIPMTEKEGPDNRVTAVRNVIYRSHDAIHQLWGLPSFTDFTEASYYEYKRSQMCGEIAVLLLSEFELAAWLWERMPDLREYLDGRCALQMNRGCMVGKSLREKAARLDCVLHRRIRPRWCREDPAAMLFCDYYEPMMQGDRREIDNNWELLKSASSSTLHHAPQSRYDPSLDGLELTLWMIDDFEHILRSGSEVDWDLASFNRARRSRVVIPAGWGNRD